jgi:hypothetical protein
MTATSNPAVIKVVDTTPRKTPVEAKSKHPGDFDRFEDLTSKLTKVPKSEVDEQRKES